ncbi:MAG TPA: isocitrate lyase/PEP mutase family protein [Ilumatobacter sp.]
MSSAARLRALLGGPGLLTVPGCSDALGARLIEQAGFDAAYMTGFGASATLLGAPDVGLLTGSEMVDNARRVAAATALPLIADGDTGYGSAVNVMRTVRDYERAGVAAIQLEDQVSPKRCGHLADKQVIPADEMTAKLRAAVEARDEMLIVARTDARAPEGLAAAIERAHAYVAAGADVLFVEALESVDEVAEVGAERFGVPLVYNWVEGGRSPALGAETVAALGYAVLLAPITLLLAATDAMQAALRRLREHGVPAIAEPGVFGRFTDTIGLPAVLDLQRRFGTER